MKPVGAPNTREVDVQPQSYWKTGDSLQIVTLIIVGIGDEAIGKTLREEGGSVQISIRVRQVTDVKAALGIPIPVAVTLKQPLGTRVVQDATGRVLKEIEAPRDGACGLSTFALRWNLSPAIRGRASA